MAARIVHHTHSPTGLLALVIVLAGFLSAILLNDTIVLMFTPLVLSMALSLKRNPMPYLIGLVAGANIGSVATILGNPQNMIIGIASGMPFGRFTLLLFPVALMGLAVAWLVLVLLYRPEFKGESQREVALPDWSLLVLFAGLFVVTGAVQETGYSQLLFGLFGGLLEGGAGPLTVGAALLSNLVSNVPAVLLLQPLVLQLPNPEQAWVVLAMATTFAGNLTLLGSIANLIAAELACAQGVHLTFREYLKAGAPITLLSLLIGVLWFSLIY